ncbi:glycosyltransferase family 2 protein [Nitrosovibrio tenuis]|nr:glycosyltransferase family 2 protein [Nitrosovibrio tenuis]
MPSIDVVIPVYNAPALTRRCIESVVRCLSPSIRHIYIQDDASGAETREMLDNLPYGDLRIYHAPKNQGFGASVNEAISRSDASYVLVLNSDTVITEDILPRLYEALVADPKLALVIPSGNDYARDNLDRYVRKPGGYIRTHRLRGHAFLMRRGIFLEIGGFDAAFGRGYYEDTDLGRRLNLRGWQLGVHPDVHIQHKGGGSFGRGQSYMQLVRHNRNLYLSRYPNASLNVLLLSGNCPLTHFPSSLLDALDYVFREGGYIHWLTPEPARLLLCLQMRSYAMGLEAIIRLMLRSWREEKRISEIWMLPDVPRLLRALIQSWARVRGIKVLSWDWAPAAQSCTASITST